MAAATLNRKLPFGSISGDPLGRMYEQDHLYFMADGSAWVAPPEPAEIVAEAAVVPVKPAAKKGKAVPHEPLAQDAQLNAQMGAA